MTDSSLPTATPSTRLCAECGGPMEGRAQSALYCSRTCNRRVASRAYRARQQENPRPTAPCAVDGCGQNQKAKSLCHKHYEHQRIHGTVVPRVIVGNDLARLLSKIDKYAPVLERNAHRGPCWIFATDINQQTGYGRLHRTGGKSYAAHRVAYELLVGSIPDGLELDHLCMVRACVNPAHLEPVTPSENTRRARAFARSERLRLAAVS